ncbi:pyridoxal phosphate-dependent decarboxylase family protein [Botrimarina mediterranea]|uniref:L-2,4-diaminobutyrate decarboxylase n=1 Tax=Botrimarina mediterranea TaxID=2528022 RepID=A0A518K532_9BACT|nr:aminotransferase class V-fold PLP-dependent enzyme [Botrimarina mediterranea]QDV72901.1 L-2,4-diaminobutyrate decarboxylase [Botrimarina mediterranea]
MTRDFADARLFADAQRYALEYLAASGERSVFPTPEAIAALSAFDETLPDGTGDAHDVLAMLHRIGSPATVNQIGGRYFGFVNGSVVPVALAAKQMASAWDQNAATYASSPLCSRLEGVVEGWLRELFGLPAETVAGFVSGSSIATFSGLAAARYRLLERLGWDVNERGLRESPPLRIVTGDQAHASVAKAINLLGFGQACVERVPTDDQGRLRIDRLPSLDDRTILILQAGNVCTGSFDPIAAAVARAREASAWTHVDGAFGLWAAASPRLADLTKGIEHAHSLSADAHKTLNTPYDNGVVLCRDREALAEAMKFAGAYLPTNEHRNGMAYTPEMSRRSRVVELWATMRYLGRQGMDDLVGGLHERAVQFGEELTAAGFRVLNDVVFNQVLVACDDDSTTTATLAAVQSSGVCWCGGTTWEGRPAIRISVSSWVTTAEDVTRCVAAFKAARALSPSPNPSLKEGGG